MTNTKRHIEELYKTGKTTFRDDQLVHKDYVVEFNDLVSGWIIVNNYLLVEYMTTELEKRLDLKPFFYKYVKEQLKQLCIDYYGDE